MWMLLLLIALIATIIFIYFITVEPAKKHVSEEAQKSLINQVPDSFKNGEITVLVKDPNTIFTHWDIPKDILNKFQAYYGKSAWENSEPLIRVYDLSEGKGQQIKEVPVDLRANNCYIEINRAGIILNLELGILLPDRSFITLARSEAVSVPATKFSNVIDPFWPPLETAWKSFSTENNIDTVSSQNLIENRPHSRD